MCSVQESLTPYGRFHLPRIQYSKFCSSWPSRNLNEVLICVCMDHIYKFTYFQITQTVFKLLQFLQLFYITKLSILNAAGYIGYNTLSDNHPYQASEHEHCALDNAARRKSALCRARPRPPRPPAPSDATVDGQDARARHSPRRRPLVRTRRRLQSRQRTHRHRTCYREILVFYRELLVFYREL